MNGRRAPLLSTLTLMIVDALMLIGAFVLAYALRRALIGPPDQELDEFSHYLGFLVVQAGTVMLVFFFARLYHLVRALSKVDMLANIGAGVSIGTLVAIGVSTLVFRNSVFGVDLARMLIVYVWVLGIVMVSLGRLALINLSSTLYRRGIGRDRVLILGTGEVGQMICQKIQGSPSLGYEVIGFADNKGEGGQLLNVPIVGRYEDLPRLIETYKVNEVVIALTEASRREIVRLISMCDRGSVGIKIFPDVFQIVTSEVTVGDLAGLPLLTVRDIELRGWKLTLKRLVDVFGAAWGLVALSPLMLLVAVLVRLESKGPVFYVQERMGLDATPFRIIKFRTMRTDAEADGPGWTVANDPRVTRLGRLLRRTSIDELPQLMNVLLGDMSLVGPRPERPVYVEQFRQSIPRYMERHREKAGLTGWAQVNGLRGDTSIEERTKYDLWYVEHWSIWLDLKIIIRTLVQMFSDRSAY
jgi:exopolysaccharide biosynthesis polyprenyl glycosylphosphotransferase